MAWEKGSTSLAARIRGLRLEDPRLGLAALSVRAQAFQHRLPYKRGDTDGGKWQADDEDRAACLELCLGLRSHQPNAGLEELAEFLGLKLSAGPVQHLSVADLQQLATPSKTVATLEQAIVAVRKHGHSATAAVAAAFHLAVPEATVRALNGRTLSANETAALMTWMLLEHRILPTPESARLCFL